MSSAVAYYRVSTQRQGRSGLGLEAQRAAVTRFFEAEGIAIVGDFTEVETGKGADALDRPRLAQNQRRKARQPKQHCRSRSNWTPDIGARCRPVCRFRVADRAIDPALGRNKFARHCHRTQQPWGKKQPAVVGGRSRTSATF